MKNIVKNLIESYSNEYIESLELSYGSSFMSEGGNDRVRDMVKNYDLKNKKVLDFGSGVGGIAYYLASFENAIVTGVDINSEMIQKSIKNTPSNINQNINFLKIDGQNLPFESETFDFIISKGVIVHLDFDMKNRIYKEFYRVLKKGGKIIIDDLLSLEDNIWSDKIKYLIESESLPLFGLCKDSYYSLLDQSNFLNIKFNLESEKYSLYNYEIANKLGQEPLRSLFTKRYGSKTLEEHIIGYKNIADANKLGEIFVYTINAEKNEI